MLLQIQLQAIILYRLPDSLLSILTLPCNNVALLIDFLFFYFSRDAWLNWEYVT